MRDPTERLRDILEAIAASERHLGGDMVASKPQVRRLLDAMDR